MKHGMPPMKQGRKTMIFDIEGEDVQDTKVPAVVTRTMLYLDTLEDGKLLTTRTLIVRIDSGQAYFKEHSNNPSLAPYKVKVKNPVRQNLWGNHKTIAAFKGKMHG